MYKQIVINVAEHETRVALLEDGTIAELFIERNDGSDIAGNIYKGRVQRVLPGMQAAFVDIGLGQAAFIYVDDVLGDNLKEIERLFESSDREDEAPFLEDEVSQGTFVPKATNIEELITEGQELLVQVVKSPMGTKGARISSYISLPGRFLVLMPTSNHIGISRRIEENVERDRLKEMVSASRLDNLGYIVRTAAEGVQQEKLSYEMGFLRNIWAGIKKKYETASCPSMIHQELSVSLRAVRDLLIQDAERLVIDSREGYESIISFLDTLMPSLKTSVRIAG